MMLLSVETDIEQIKASVDGAKLDVRSAAQKFAEMDPELAKQNKKPLTFNGVAYGHGGRAFRTKEQERKEAQRKNDMATRIQSRVRGAMAREAYNEKLTAAERIAIRIQSEFRRRQAQKKLAELRDRLQREQTCAVVIQKIVRGRHLFADDKPKLSTLSRFKQLTIFRRLLLECSPADKPGKRPAVFAPSAMQQQFSSQCSVLTQRKQRPKLG
ncbi:unnamed protein product [Phytophthora lilii]|uniref:Unnamed protein product n=1 Tax=Phytophthora lilii TaxID=2077276 RepID=A0A9W6WYJ2_9STRA|nr:unnamed protein product [Phytophthora lilii]